MKKYHTTFDFVETEEKAKKLCASIDAKHTAYIRKRHPSIYAKWDCADGSFNGYAVKYVY